MRRWEWVAAGVLTGSIIAVGVMLPWAVFTHTAPADAPIHRVVLPASEPGPDVRGWRP